MFKNVFSIEKDEYHKIITILGLKFKFVCKKSLMNELLLLRTILEQSIDITKVPKATGNLRKVQLLKLELLKLLKIITDKHNISFWLEYGTLIGAIRHKGFIPWDDDIDVALLKEDYIRLWDVLRDELKDTKLVVQSGSKTGSDIIKIYYDKFNIDIFPFEFINKRYETPEEKSWFIKKWKELTKLMLTKYSLKLFHSQKINFFGILEEVQKLKNKVFGEFYLENKSSGQLIRCVETMQISEYYGILEADDLYPLKEVDFEENTFFIPSKPIDHLQQLGDYGDEYGSVMRFPSLNDAGFAHTQRKHFDCQLNLDEMINYLENLVDKYKDSSKT